MRKPGIAVQGSCIIVAMFCMASCSPVAKGPLPVVPEPNHVETNIVSDTAKLAQEKFAQGLYKQALDIYSTAYDKYHHAGLRLGYSKLSEQIRTASDTAFARGDFAEAGSIYTVLFENGITTRDFANSLTFDDDYLTGQIKMCSKTLMEAGLMRYREEKLHEAISLWKKVLLFDPDNRDARNAIDRATIQLQQLNTIR